MRTTKSIFFAIAIIAGFLLLLFTGCETAKEPWDMPAVLDESYYTDKYSYSEAGILGRGINMGNFLDAPGEEGTWSSKRLIQKNDFTVIKTAGFKHVRIPVRWSDHAAKTSPYRIDPKFTARVKQVVDWALGAGLLVVVNVHHYVDMFEPENAVPFTQHRERLKAFWGQICDLFPLNRTYPREKLVFELLNEPWGRVGASEWNQIVAELTEVIWTQKKQTARKIMIGTPAEGCDGKSKGCVKSLYNLSLPAACNKENTIITVHNYEPIRFTHQGASWHEGALEWLGTPWTGTAAEQRFLINLFNTAAAWNKDKNFEINMGEFGAYSPQVEPSHQKAWTALVARESEKRGWSWTYWEFCLNFGAYDPYTEEWYPELIDALIPLELRK